MNRTELIDQLAAATGHTKKDADAFLSAFIETVQSETAKGNDVTLIGFGAFSAMKVAARTGRNPQTGEAMKIAATTRPKFSPGAKFKAAVAGAKKASTKTAKAKK